MLRAGVDRGDGGERQVRYPEVADVEAPGHRDGAVGECEHEGLVAEARAQHVESEAIRRLAVLVAQTSPGEREEQERAHF